MPHIEKRVRTCGKPTYRVRVKYGGRVLTSSHQDRKSAERWAAEKGAAIRDDAHFTDAAKRRRRMADLIDRYVEAVLPHKRDRRNPSAQLRWWRHYLGALTVGETTRSVITAGRDELGKPRTNGNTPAGATVVRYLAVLSHVFTVAIRDWEWADTNPVQGVRRPREARGRDRYLLEDERTRLLAACRASSSESLYDYVVLALCTGMRRGEVASLEWRDVDLERGVIVLRDTKNGERRGVPLCNAAVEVLRARFSNAAPRGRLVFPGKTPSHSVDIKTPWETAVRRAALDNFRFHDLRHSCASYLAMTGARELEIAAILGHKTLQMTKRYSHHSVAHLKNALERANEGVIHG